MSSSYPQLTPQQLDEVRAALAEGEAAMRGISPETMREASRLLDGAYSTAADCLEYVETLRKELISAHQITEDEPLTPQEIIKRHIRYREDYVEGPSHRVIRSYGR